MISMKKKWTYETRARTTSRATRGFSEEEIGVMVTVQDSILSAWRFHASTGLKITLVTETDESTTWARCEIPLSVHTTLTKESWTKESCSIVFLLKPITLLWELPRRTPATEAWKDSRNMVPDSSSASEKQEMSSSGWNGRKMMLVSSVTTLCRESQKSDTWTRQDKNERKQTPQTGSTDETWYATLISVLSRVRLRTVPGWHSHASSESCSKKPVFRHRIMKKRKNKDFWQQQTSSFSPAVFRKSEEIDARERDWRVSHEHKNRTHEDGNKEMKKHTQKRNMGIYEYQCKKFP